MSISLHRYPGRWALGIILITTLARLLFIATGQLTLVQDEAQYWDWTRHPQLSYYSKGPLITWVISLWTSIFGNTELGVRFGSVLHSACTQAVLYFGVARCFRRPLLGLATLFVFNTMLIFMGLSILMTTDSPLILCYAAFLFALYSALRPGPGDARSPLPFIIMALTLALGILAKYMMLIAAAQALLYAWILRRHLRKGVWPALFLVIIVGTILGMLPIVAWNIQNHWVGFKHVAHLSGATGTSGSFLRFDRFPDYIGSQLALATPWWLFLLLAEACRQLWGRRTKESDSFHLTNQQSTLLLVFFLPLWVFVFFWSFHTKIMPNWVAVSYIPGTVLAAAGLLRLVESSAPRTRIWKKVIPALAVALFLLAQCFHLLPIPREMDPTRRVKGWRQLGETVEHYRDSLPDADRAFIFSDQYDMTSALA
ncbi:MAG: ArnT family glycosyltransferase, partial [Desulfovibrionaceae bacterium]